MQNNNNINNNSININIASNESLLPAPPIIPPQPDDVIQLEASEMVIIYPCNVNRYQS